MASKVPQSVAAPLSPDPDSSISVGAELARLHAGENAHGPSPAALRAVTDQLGRIHRYPDSDSTQLVDAIADHHDVDRERITVGNGVDEVILLLALALADERRPAVITGATFRSYAESLSAIRQPFISCPLDGYRLPVEDIAAQLRRHRGFAFVCTPHNPTGGTLDRHDLDMLCRAAIESGATLIVDEAYAEFAGDDFASVLPAAGSGANICVLRTFSKAYGLAGLRVGYAVGDPAVIARVNRLHGAVPYNVNLLAQHAAVAALADQTFMRRTVELTVRAREEFRRGLAELGLRCLPSHANFVLVEVGDNSADLVSALLRHGYQVRDTGDMGLPGHMRISIGTPDQMKAILAMLDELLANERLRPAPQLPAAARELAMTTNRRKN